MCELTTSSPRRAAGFIDSNKYRLKSQKLVKMCIVDSTGTLKWLAQHYRRMFQGAMRWSINHAKSRNLNTSCFVISEVSLNDVYMLSTYRSCYHALVLFSGHGQGLLKGVKGQKGDKGHPGGPGLPGHSGPAGWRGVSGPPGPSGDAGRTGATGFTGSSGPRGERGGPGFPGPAGTRGEPGGRGPPVREHMGPDSI